MAETKPELHRPASSTRAAFVMVNKSHATEDNLLVVMLKYGSSDLYDY